MGGKEHWSNALEEATPRPRAQGVREEAYCLEPYALSPTPFGHQQNAYTFNELYNV
jgi:hypothetical protein